MNTPAPVNKAIDFYNQLVPLAYDQKDEIGRLAWKLQSLHHKDHRDLDASVALLSALSMLGKANEAHDLANEIWAHRFLLKPQAAATYKSNLFKIGEWDRFYSLSTSLSGGTAHPKDQEAYSVITGDAEYLRSLSNVSENDPRFVALAVTMAKAGILDFFTGHQSTVHRSLGGRFTNLAYAVFNEEDSDDVNLNCVYFIDAPLSERRAIESRIDSDLAAYYLSQGVEPSIYSTILISMVCDIDSHPVVVSS
ncbi:MAG: hypothetical protein OEL53_06185 [Rhodospirillales bacterium]|nr:hypothetical protein [Rhodospirillales bacterium]